MTEGHYTADPNFVMPTAKEPPRDPATPRPIDVERERRAEAARSQRAQDIRSQALGYAVRTIDLNADPIPLAELLAVADHFVVYITDGTTP